MLAKAEKWGNWRRWRAKRAGYNGPAGEGGQRRPCSGFQERPSRPRRLRCPAVPTLGRLPPRAPASFTQRRFERCRSLPQRRRFNTRAALPKRRRRVALRVSGLPGGHAPGPLHLQNTRRTLVRAQTKSRLEVGGGCAAHRGAESAPRGAHRPRQRGGGSAGAGVREEAEGPHRRQNPFSGEDTPRRRAESRSFGGAGAPRRRQKGRAGQPPLCRAPIGAAEMSRSRCGLRASCLRLRLACDPAACGPARLPASRWQKRSRCRPGLQGLHVAARERDADAVQALLLADGEAPSHATNESKTVRT